MGGACECFFTPPSGNPVSVPAQIWLASQRSGTGVLLTKKRFQTFPNHVMGVVITIYTHHYNLPSNIQSTLL